MDPIQNQNKAKAKLKPIWIQTETKTPIETKAAPKPHRIESKPVPFLQ